MKHIIVIVIFLFLLCFGKAWEAQDKRPNINPLKTQFTGVFVLRWPAAYCQYIYGADNIQCHSQKLGLWDSTSFIIGGLWSSTKTTKPFKDFNLQYVQSDRSVTDRLHNYWPKLYHENDSLSFQHDTHSLWKKEWQTHGKHFCQILEILFPGQYDWYDQPQFQKGYFMEALALYERRFQNCKKLLKSSILHPEKQFLLEEYELATLLRIDEDSFKLRCIPGSYNLYEIHICIQISEDGIDQTNCRKVEKEANMKMTSNCPPQFELLDYGKNDENIGGRVFAYREEIIQPNLEL